MEQSKIIDTLETYQIDTHFSHCILIEQVQAVAAVHKDSSEVKSVNNWV